MLIPTASHERQVGDRGVDQVGVRVEVVEDDHQARSPESQVVYASHLNQARWSGSTGGATLYFFTW